MKKLLILVLLLSSSAFGACLDLYAPGLKLKANTTELCNTFYVVSYDELKNVPVFVSEKLTHGSPIGSIQRLNDFKSDSRIKNSPTNADYNHTGFDRGHLAPAGDASTQKESDESFYLSNMTPQEPTVNRISWKVLEEHTRDIFTKSKNDVYVVTFPVYDKSPKLMSNKIFIPIGYWKVVLHDGIEQYFYADNIPHAPVVEKKNVDWKSLIK